MTNTTLGFPYPAATDPPAGHTQIQALADAVDLQPGVGSFTQAQITAFTAGEKRAGRIVWNSTTGTLQRCDGSAFVDVVLASGAQTLASKTLTTPTIGSMVNANHNHSAGAGGGLIPESSVTNLVSDLAAKVASTIVDAKGDLIVATAADTVSRLAVGTNGQALVADSTAGTGLKWGNAGSVLQVVSSALSTRFVTSSHTAVDIGLSATITLGSASNKVLVCTSLICGGPAADWVAEFTRLRNGSSYGPQGRLGWLWAGVSTRPQSLTSMYLDSPASTSALTYKVQVQSELSNEVVINGRGYDTALFGESTLTLMEIAA